MTAFGLDPDDDSRDPATPVGIGNTAGTAVVAAHHDDGMNPRGDRGRTYHPRPYADYTGYVPVNTAYALTDPTRWQPALGPHQRRVGGGPGDKGVYTVQQFLTPSCGWSPPHLPGPRRLPPRAARPPRPRCPRRLPRRGRRGPGRLGRPERRTEGQGRVLRTFTGLPHLGPPRRRPRPRPGPGRLGPPLRHHRPGPLRQPHRRLAPQTRPRRRTPLQRRPPRPRRHPGHRLGRPRPGHRHRPARRPVERLPPPGSHPEYPLRLHHPVLRPGPGRPPLPRRRHPRLDPRHPRRHHPDRTRPRPRRRPQTDLGDLDRLRERLRRQPRLGRRRLPRHRPALHPLRRPVRRPRPRLHPAPHRRGHRALTPAPATGGNHGHAGARPAGEEDSR